MRVRHLRGVRYAHLADPADRTSPAVPVAGIAEEAPHIFPQVPGGLDPLIGPALGELPQSDNAFLLDAWVPEGASPDGAPSLPESAPSNAASPEAASPDAAPTLPVLVMVPGGAFISGAGTVRWYDGERLAREGMVVVVPNYRLGAPGVIGTRTRPANRGLADLVTALRWVADHAQALGADPARITLAGQSAGAWYALALAQHREVAPLVRRLALLSLPWQPPLPGDEYERRAATFFDALEAPDDDAAPPAAPTPGPGSPEGTLATAPREAVLAAQRAVAQTYRAGPAFRPALGDGVAPTVQTLPEAVRATGAEAWWLSTTRDEALAFLAGAPDAAFDEGAVRGYVGAHFAAPDAFERLVEQTPKASWKERLARAMTLYEFELFARHVAEAAREEGREVTLTRLELGSPMLGGASPHCFELPFVFGNAQQWHDAPMLEGLADAEVAQASRAMVGLLAGLVVDGRPRTDLHTADGAPVRVVGAAVGGEDGAPVRVVSGAVGGQSVQAAGASAQAGGPDGWLPRY